MLTAIRDSRALYHEVRPYLYSENTFIFRRCGSDLRIIFQPRDASCCGEALSPLRTKVPFFNKVVFKIGGGGVPDIGRFKTESFKAALVGLRDEVQINHLTILLDHSCWATGSECIEFAFALRNIKVTRSLQILGTNEYLLHDIRSIPRALAMNIQPVWSKLYPSDVFAADTNGVFTSTYVAAKTPEEIDIQPGQQLMDAGVEYYALLMASCDIGW